MFTGIIRGKFPIVRLEDKPGLRQFDIALSAELAEGLTCGASISVDGVCLTAARIDGTTVGFDAMEETLRKTTIGELTQGNTVNVERSARMGDEIGGHVMSGHVSTMAQIVAVEESQNNKAMKFQVAPEWMRYIFSKGFIGLDGASLTVVDADTQAGTFQVWFIPETLRLTRFGEKGRGDRVNVEIDAMTQTVVETTQRVLSEKN
ncbi:riboflavin synthase subunit alpha [Candidatus Parcubacteria bacterium]|nr:riboflavin synthase subunit alpha [Candidatus Parcubacteria bacterium]